MRLRGWVLVVLAAVGIAASACGSSDACAPNEQAACACPGGADGVQVCAASGDGYGACDCGDSTVEGGCLSCSAAATSHDEVHVCGDGPAEGLGALLECLCNGEPLTTNCAGYCAGTAELTHECVSSGVTFYGDLCTMAYSTCFGAAP